MEKYLARELVRALPCGEKWDFDTAKQIGDRIGVDWKQVSKNDWYIIFNQMYSEHCATAQRHNICTEIFFAELAIDHITIQ